MQLKKIERANLMLAHTQTKPKIAKLHKETFRSD